MGGGTCALPPLSGTGQGAPGEGCPARHFFPIADGKKLLFFIRMSSAYLHARLLCCWGR
jgi:hypothetical protein